MHRFVLRGLLSAAAFPGKGEMPWDAGQIELQAFIFCFAPSEALQQVGQPAAFMRIAPGLGAGSEEWGAMGHHWVHRCPSGALWCLLAIHPRTTHINTPPHIVSHCRTPKGGWGNGGTMNEFMGRQWDSTVQRVGHGWGTRGVR